MLEIGFQIHLQGGEAADYDYRTTHIQCLYFDLGYQNLKNFQIGMWQKKVYIKRSHVALSFLLEQNRIRWAKRRFGGKGIDKNTVDWSVIRQSNLRPTLM